LRRNALGLARTIIERGIDLDLPRLIEAARGQLGPIGAQTTNDELYDFIIDRLRAYYADKGVPPQQFEAVAALRPVSLLDFDRRLQAIGAFAVLPEAEALAAANKRIRNILKKAEGDVASAVDAARFTDGAERELGEAVDAAVGETDASLKARDYVAVLGRLARLRPQVDAFFDQVMVNVDDAAVRNNRLALLKRLADRLGSVAAIEHLST
jgi:glycyl-tRNA synthetase beta chain